MKKFLILFYALLIGFSSFAYTPGKIDEKLLLSFKTTFPDAEGAHWQELKTYYVVNFTDNGIHTMASYGKDGTLLRFSRYYLEENLPYFVHFKVQKKYPGKNIYGITETTIVAEPGDQLLTEYRIVLEDQKNWTIVNLGTDNHLSVLAKYRKAL